jgi:hypothetical protein
MYYKRKNLAVLGVEDPPPSPPKLTSAMQLLLATQQQPTQQQASTSTGYVQQSTTEPEKPPTGVLVMVQAKPAQGEWDYGTGPTYIQPLYPVDYGVQQGGAVPPPVKVGQKATPGVAPTRTTVVVPKIKKEFDPDAYKALLERLGTAAQKERARISNLATARGAALESARKNYTKSLRAAQAIASAKWEEASRRGTAGEREKGFKSAREWWQTESAEAAKEFHNANVAAGASAQDFSSALKRGVQRGAAQAKKQVNDFLGDAPAKKVKEETPKEHQERMQREKQARLPGMGPEFIIRKRPGAPKIEPDEDE